VRKNQINGLLLAAIIVNSCVLVGCHRSYYRRQADMEAARLIREKSVDPRWNSATGSIEIDPQSRMFNPFSQDHPPIPPDDAASHQLMYSVDGKEGYPHWHANGDTNYVESPTWKSFLPMNERGQVVLTLDRAYRLALIHSPTLQQQRETLYLSALDVSLERFGFDSQLFTGFNSFLTTQGSLRGPGGRSATTLSSQIGENGGGLNIERLGITGANFAVGLANTILFNFAGNNTQSANSLIDFSIIQPLLRGAGRERILESLTQSERTLLANVRQLERFKRGFYLQVAIGRNPGAGPNPGGNFLNTPGSANINVGGFFGLLQSQQQIRNQEFNVRQQEAVLEQFREFFLRERLDAISLKQFETNVYRQQRGLLGAKTNYQASLDSFKQLIGLPPDLDVVIEDPFLDAFELISDQINERMITISDLRKRTGAGLNEVYSAFEGVGIDVSWEDFTWPEELDKDISKLAPFIDVAESMVDKILKEDREVIETDLDKLATKRDSRIAYLRNVKRTIDSGEIISSVDPKLFEEDSIITAEELRKTLINPELDARDTVIGADGREELAPRSILKRAEILKAELQDVKAKIANFSKVESTLSREVDKNRPESDPELYKYIISEFQQRIPGQLSELNNLALEMSLVQALARSNSIEINDVTIDVEHAIRIARCMRRDWMNARASLVDQWRNIEFVADQLEAGVDLVFEGDVGNTGDNPFSLRLATGELRGGFRFDAPIVRLSERNAYRNALIQYQQSRRSFYQFEDSIKQNIRNIIRELNRAKVLFELDRLTVQVDIQNVEINRLALDAPVSAGAAGGNNARLGTQTSRNLTDAIGFLNGSQDSFVGTWVQFEALRRSLDFDLGTMQVDDIGAWVDPGEIDSSIGSRAAGMLGIQLDCQFCENIEMSYVRDAEQPFNFDEAESEDQYQPAEAEPMELDGPSDAQPIPPTDVPNSIPSLDSDTGKLQRFKIVPDSINVSSDLSKSPAPQANDLEKIASVKSVMNEPAEHDSAAELDQAVLQVVEKIDQKSAKPYDPFAGAYDSKMETPLRLPFGIAQSPSTMLIDKTSDGFIDSSFSISKANRAANFEIENTIRKTVSKPAAVPMTLETKDQPHPAQPISAPVEPAIKANEPPPFQSFNQPAKAKETVTRSKLTTPVDRPIANWITPATKAVETTNVESNRPERRIEANNPMDLQKQRSSLGGVLNRFRGSSNQ